MIGSISYRNLVLYLITIFVLAVLFFYFYEKAQVKTVSYSGISLSAENLSKPKLAQTIILSDEAINSDKIEFSQRKITGGGINPGWVISLVETQPNIFTGRVIVDDGVYQHPVTLREDVENIYVGEMKGVNNIKEIFSLKKINGSCIDEEGNTFEYSLTGSYGKTEINGCGGELVKEAVSL